MPLRLSIIGVGILLLFFYKSFIDSIKKSLGVFGEIFIVVFPAAINIILFYLFYKYKIKFDYH
jgi:hypothetical protein